MLLKYDLDLLVKLDQGEDILKDFKAFILRGNVVDLAVGIMIGSAFNTVIMSFVKNILTPLITIPGRVNFSQLYFKLGNSIFRYGAFLNDVISFIIIAAGIFFFVVRPINSLNKKIHRGTDPSLEKKSCPQCLSSIPKLALRCAFCTIELKDTSK